MAALDLRGPSAGRARTIATRATVFGLDVEAEIPLSFLRDAPARPTGRTLELAPWDGAPWPETATVVCDQREADGSVHFRIEADREAGYLLWGPAYGRHRLSRDGCDARFPTAGASEDARQRLLVAQVLPFAALLRGLEVFHASAVVRGGEAIAFVGNSGAGKTSVALELCRRGASFLADDVLAVERAGRSLLGHPGTPVAGLDHGEARRLREAGAAGALESVAVNVREQLVRMRGAAGPAPLSALFFLQRSRRGPAEPQFEPAGGGQPLLAATFNSVLTDPERLRGLLDVCALVARVRVERISCGPGVDAERLGEAIERRLDAST
jgi:hypothetical protein